MALLKHIVFIKSTGFKSKKEKADFLKELYQRLYTLKGIIPEIKAMEIGKNISKRNTAFDMSLLVEFESEQDLAIYAKHSEHVKVLDFMHSTKLETAVVDYYVE